MEDKILKNVDNNKILNDLKEECIIKLNDYVFYLEECLADNKSKKYNYVNHQIQVLQKYIKKIDTYLDKLKEEYENIIGKKVTQEKPRVYVRKCFRSNNK